MDSTGAVLSISNSGLTFPVIPIGISHILMAATCYDTGDNFWATAASFRAVNVSFGRPFGFAD